MTPLKSKISLIASGVALGLLGSACASTAIKIWRIDYQQGGLLRKQEKIPFEEASGMYCTTSDGMKRITEKIDYCNRFCK